MDIKYNLKLMATDIVSKIPFLITYKLIGTNVIIPYYHMVNDSEVQHIKHLYPHKTVKQFIADIDYLLNNFNPIHLNDVLSFIKKGHALPSKALLLTFDDGFREMHDIVAPILLQKGVPATFFINSAFVDNKSLCYQHKASILVEHILKKNISTAVQKQIEGLLLQQDIKAGNITSGILAIKYQQRDLVDNIAQLLDVHCNDYLLRHKPYLTTEQITKLIRDGFAIGAHSIDHPLYANLSLEVQLRQTTESVNFVKDKFGLNYTVFAFPHSDNGVTKKYYEEINKRGIVDIHFGTAGMMDDSVPNSLQRFSLEKPLLPAANIINWQFARRLLRIVKRNNKIIRE